MPARHRHPRRRRGGLAALAALALGLLAPAPAPAAGVDTPNVSGLPWRSGVSFNPYDEEGDFAAWRGRPLDVSVLFVPHETWDRLLSQLRGAYFRGECRATPLCVVSLAMFPESAAGQFRPCAGGSFDANHREMARLIADARPGAVVRMAWEANSHAGHPWRIRTAANIEPYKACFRRLARIHRAAGLLVEWTNTKDTQFPFMVAYPGDDVVDLWGLHDYDNAQNDLSFVDYVAAAARRGKKVGVGEWGLRRNGDNPDFVRRTFEQFRANAANLAYESYFNRKAEHKLHPSTRYPRSAQAYRELWGR